MVPESEARSAADAAARAARAFAAVLQSVTCFSCCSPDFHWQVEELEAAGRGLRSISPEARLAFDAMSRSVRLGDHCGSSSLEITQRLWEDFWYVVCCARGEVKQLLSFVKSPIEEGTEQFSAELFRRLQPSGGERRAGYPSPQDIRMLTASIDQELARVIVSLRSHPGLSSLEAGTSHTSARPAAPSRSAETSMPLATGSDQEPRSAPAGGAPIRPTPAHGRRAPSSAKASHGRMAALRAARRDLRLKGNEDKIIKRLCRNGGAETLMNLGLLCEWEDETGAWNSARKRLNDKLKKYGWKLLTHNRKAVAEAFPASARK